MMKIDGQRVALLLTGNELMSGDTVDSNSSRIALALGEQNMGVSRKITVGDETALLESSLTQLCDVAPVVIINGGLGPTDDDMTADVVAKVLGVSLTQHPEALHHLEGWCQRRGLDMNQANLKQTWLPDGAEVVANPIGSAVGFQVEINNSLVIATPGVPVELSAMLPDIGNRIAARIGGGQTFIRRLQTFGIGESTIQELVHARASDWPEQVTLGFRSGLPQLELKLQIASEADIELRDQAEGILMDLIGDHIIGTDNDRLALAVQRVLRDRGMTMTTAESCTGGLIASMITKEPGSSAVIGSGFLTYANTSKRDVLGVPQATLDQHGAVSEPVVKAMLSGTLKVAKADIGVAVSGIAGPTGGSDDKPVGTVWIAWGSEQVMNSIRLRVPGDRERFQVLVAAIGLDLIRRQLLALPELPYYIERFRQTSDNN